MKRYRDDSVKSGKGIDGDLGEDYTKKFNVYDRMGRAYPGQKSPERSQPGAYTTNDAGLNNVDDFSYRAGSRDIFDDVMANSRPRGDDNWGFDATGEIRSGVNRSQSEGNKDPRRGK